MPAPTIVALFQSFTAGKQLVDAGDLAALVNKLFSSATGLIATPGGTQAAALPLTATWNELDTVTTNSDSVMLPIALPGNFIYINNSTGQTLAVFGQLANSQNSNAGDTIAAHNSNTQQATATGVTQLTTVPALYVCTTLGQWKQFITG